MNTTFRLTRLLFSLLTLIVVSLPARTTALAGNTVGTIAYVRLHQPDGDEIHLIEPDGSGERQIFATGYPYPDILREIGALDWSPNAAELVFNSSHENACSLYESDLYTIRADGSNYRRITDPPACGARAGIPTGTVVVPVQNNTGTNGPFVFYMEGAPGPLSMVVASGGTATLTFNNVADYGDQDQYVMWAYGLYRSWYPSGKVDVIPGTTQQAGVLQIQNGFENYGFYWPQYLPDGSAVASIQMEYFLYTTPSHNNEMGLVGTEKTFDMTIEASHLAWAPIPELADTFLFYGWITDQNYNTKFPIMIGNVNDTAATPLIDIDPNEMGNHLLGLTWLPDGSGFLYSFSEMIGFDFRANIWEYSFATKESTRLTDLPYGFAREITVSPDGQKIVFELQQSEMWYDPGPIDLYMVNRDGSGLDLFVEDARSPAWSPKAIPEFKYIYLPAVRR